MDRCLEVRHLLAAWTLLDEMSHMLSLLGPSFALFGIVSSEALQGAFDTVVTHK
jgi:hypothetical protein